MCIRFSVRRGVNNSAYAERAKSVSVRLLEQLFGDAFMGWILFYSNS